MNNRHKAAVWFLAALTTFLTSGCGNTFRPIAGPLPQPGGNPASLANAIVVSSSPSLSGPAAGDTMHLDVAGDTTAAIHTVGVNPIQAVLVGARTFVINQGDNTVTDYLTFGGPGTSVTTTTLSGTCPTFADSHDTSHLFVAMQNPSTGGCGLGGPGAVANVSPLSLTQSGTTAVGTDPESLAELANGSEVYVANKGSNNVTIINVVDGSVTQPAIAVGSSPSYVIASPDSACVYVANSGGNTVSVISTSTHTLAASITTASGPSFLKFDANLGRVYVANTLDGSVSVLLHNSSCVPTVLKTIPGIGLSPGAIAPLANGTRFYVANSGDNTVTVVDASSLTVKSKIAVAGAPVSIAAASDSSRVYSANFTSSAGPGSVSIIATANDQVLKTVTAPACNPAAGSTTPACSTQNPVFVTVAP